METSINKMNLNVNHDKLPNITEKLHFVSALYTEKGWNREIRFCFKKTLKPI